MKKEIYCSAMKKFKMSDECVGEILDAIDEVTLEPKEKKVRHIKLIPLITAAVVLVFGSITVAAKAGGFDWIKIFTEDDDFIISEELMEMAGEMQDFKYESNCNVKLSPIGVIATEKNLYCLFNIDENPDSDNVFYSFNNDENSDPDETYYYNWFDKFTINGSDEISYSGNSEIIKAEEAANDKDVMAVTINLADDGNIFKENDRINIEHVMKYDEDKQFKYDVSTEFTLKFGDIKTLDIDYSKYMCDDIPERDYDFMIDYITIDPLSIHVYANRYYYADAMLNDGFTIVLNDGTCMDLKECGFSASGSWSSESFNTTVSERGLPDIEYQTSSRFPKPINPDDIDEIYLGKMKIYEKE